MRRYFTVPGPPQGKVRPRVVNRNGYAHSYTPEKTVNYEALVKMSYKSACTGEPMATGPVTVKITAWFPVPQSWSQAKKAAAMAGITQPTVKPDADNIGKIICDALNGIAWPDDKQVTRLDVRKAYGAEPRVEVEIWEA